MGAEKTEQKQRGDHLFKPGQSGNPSGRPKGALNRTTRAAIVLLEGESEALTRKAIDLAKAGDMTAMRLCLERLIPRAKARPLMETETLPETVSEALSVVLQAVNDGALLPFEAKALGDILEARRKAKEDEQWESAFSFIGKSSSPVGDDEQE